MALSQVLAPATEPLTLDEVKQHLRVVDGVEDENGLIVSLIPTAREYVESFTGRPLIAQTWDDKRDGFPCAGGAIVLPYPPVSAVSSITYLDTAGVSQAWGASNYLTDLPSGPKAQPARITPAYGVSYPSTYPVVNAVQIRFVCGYGSASSVPESLKAAMKVLIGHWYQNRESVVVGVGVGAVAIPHSVDALLWPYRVF
jgi:uncharacterized phiE125 gp8 family phage protein